MPLSAPEKVVGRLLPPTERRAAQRTIEPTPTTERALMPDDVKPDRSMVPPARLMRCAAPAVLEPLKLIWLLFVMVALPAVLLSRKVSTPPAFTVMVEFAAVLVLRKFRPDC